MSHFRLVALMIGLLSAVTPFTGGQMALADGSGNANVTYDVGCMQDIAGFALNCTANDVQLAAAENIKILDDGCAFPGDSVTFEAQFRVLLTAQARHDIGIWFSQDGDPNSDGAISGTCTSATPAYAPDSPWLDLDGTNDPLPGNNKPSGIQDTCGDIDYNHNPLLPVIKLTVKCIDPDEDGKLNLPNCTSWRQSGANDLCDSPTDAFPGSPSKCRCDIGFNIDIDVPKAELKVEKTAIPNEVLEPGGDVTFKIKVTNTGIDPNNPVTLYTLSDNIYKDITRAGHDGIVSTKCELPQTICPDVPTVDCPAGGFIGTYECEFTAEVKGNAGDEVKDTVIAGGVDARGNEISGKDDATVTINDVKPDIEVVKIASPTEVYEPGGDVTFTVMVTNKSVSSSDPVTIDSLYDDIYGDLNGQGDCIVSEEKPWIIPAGASSSCSFTAKVSGNAGHSETDIVTAEGYDDENNPLSKSASATVYVNDVPSRIELVKTANPGELEEPGGNVTYTFTVNNKSAVDTVTINSLYDDHLGDLNGQGTCSVPQEIAKGDGYTCTVTVPVEGDAFDKVTNTATAVGIDDDNQTHTVSSSATVNITNVDPKASLTKTVTEVLVTYVVKVCNDSDAEVLFLDSLLDNIYGDVADVKNSNIMETNCIVPQTLNRAGEDGSCYTCSFKALATESPTTDIVTGTVNDNDESNPAKPSDSATVTFK